MEHRPDIAAGWVAPADCSKWNIKEEIRVGSKPPFNEKTSKPNKQAFSCGSLFRMGRISTARRSVSFYVRSGVSYEASIFCNGSYWEEYFSQRRYCQNPPCGTFPDPGFGIER